MRSIARWRAAAASLLLLRRVQRRHRDAARRRLRTDAAGADAGRRRRRRRRRPDAGRRRAVHGGDRAAPGRGGEPHLLHLRARLPDRAAVVGEPLRLLARIPNVRRARAVGQPDARARARRVVIVYNCGSAGCADEVARAQAFIDALPLDSARLPVDRRVILAPDPTLPVRWAASAWTWTLRADCFDETAFRQFYTDHYDQAAESICSGGAPYANLCDGVVCGWRGRSTARSRRSSRRTGVR